MIAGYSGTPLERTRGLKPGMRAWLDAMPDNVRAEIGPAAIGFVEQREATAGLDVFVTARAELERHLTALRDLIQPAGQIWVSWAKKVSNVPTDVTEDVIRDVCLPLGLVDVKVCAIDDIWSGLKLVVRRELRG